MNREIKFKVWDKKNERFAYPTFPPRADGWQEIIGNIFENKNLIN